MRTTIDRNYLTLEMLLLHCKNCHSHYYILYLYILLGLRSSLQENFHTQNIGQLKVSKEKYFIYVFRVFG